MKTIVEKQKESQTSTKIVEHKILPELFAIQARKAPNKIATRLGDFTMTYQELDVRASKIAHYIQHNFLEKHGNNITENTFIAILSEKNLDMITGILGVLKAGAAYLVINPKDPEERIEYLLKQSGAAFLLQIESDYTQNICPILRINDKNLKAYSSITPSIKKIDGRVAQLIYTSGSTGTPKGVMITHRNISNRLIHPNFITVTPEDCFLQIANYAFDASTFEIFGTLLNGASLILVNQKLLLDFESLTHYIRKYKVTIAFFTTSFFNAIVDQCIEMLESINQIFFGGEAASIIHTKKALAHLGPKRLTNIYGPTECTIFTAFYNIEEILPEQKSIPIGIPVNNDLIYILNEQLDRVKLGEPGEIYVRSLSVAKGYYKMPELTSKVFQKGVLGENEVIYKTGDLGRINQKGVLEFLGRNDSQIKLRGYRIELDEIAYHTMVHAKVNYAIADIKKDGKNVGYIVVWVKAISQIAKKELRDFLATKVPDYMLPRHIVFIDEIPLTPNGKLDKKKLPNPLEEVNKLSLESKRYSKKEEKLRLALKEILTEQHIEVEANFFALGLDSISALNFITEARKQHLYFSASEVYNYPTIAELALVVKEVKKQKNKKNTFFGEIGLTPIQKWFFDLDFIEPNYFQQSQTIIIQAINVEELQRAFLNLVNSHRIFRIKFHKNDANYVQSYSNTKINDSFISLHSVKKVEDENSAIDAIKKELESQISLQDNVLFKVALIEGKDEKYHVYITLHHLIVDGVSWRILIEDLVQLYKGKRISKTDDFHYWYQQLNAFANHEKTQYAIPLWKSISEQLGEFVLPKNQDTVHLTHSYNYINGNLSVEKTKALSKVCFKAYNTNVETLLLTAYVTSLVSLVNKNKIAFMLESHGREKCVEDVDVSRTIGWFTSTYPMVITLPDNMEVQEKIIAVKEQLKAIPDNGLSYGALKYLHADLDVRNTIKDTCPEAWFNYLGIFENHQHDLPKGWNLFDEKSGHDILGTKNKHWSPFEFNCSIVNKQFIFKLSYDENQFSRRTAENFSGNFKKNLLDIIAHCTRKKEVCYTASDFGLAHLNQPTFSKLYNTLKTKGEIRTLTPVTSLQRGMLFHYLKNNESDQYYVQVKIKISGNLEKEYLKKKLQALIKENEVFRSIFIWKDLKEPLQCAYEYDEFLNAINWSEVSLVEKDSNTKELEINRIIRNDRKKKFNLSAEPAIRFLLIKEDENSHILLWTIHHILIDGWSIYHILNDLSKSFQSKKDTNNFHQSKSLQFHHLMRWFGAQNKTPALKFWKTQLSLIKEITPFSNAKINPVSPDKPIEIQEEHSLVFSKQTTNRIKDLARRYEVTLNSLFHFAWAKMLHLYTNDDHVIFGVTVSGRNHDFQDIDHVIGPLINTLPVVTSWGKQKTIHEQAQSIHKTFQYVNQYSYVGLNELLTMTDLKTPHLFNHILVFENHKKNAKYQSNSNGIKIVNVEEIEKTNYPITVLGSLENESLQIKVVYDADCFGKNMIDNMLKVVEEVLEYIILHPETDCNQIIASAPVQVSNYPQPNELENKAHRNFIKEVQIKETEGEEQKSQMFINLWEKVLDQNKISIKDDFFYLGGHSLNALELSNELKRKGVIVSVNDIYKHRTIESLLALKAENQDNHEDENRVLYSDKESDNKTFPLSPLQNRFIKRNLINRNRFNVPFLARIKLNVGFEAINNTVTKIVDTHKSLQIRFIKENDAYKQYYYQDLERNYCDYYDINSVELIAQDKFISEKCEEQQSQFDLLNGEKLFKVLVFDNYLNTTNKVVFFLFHHIVFDGVSLQIFINDFFKLLNTKVNKKDFQQKVSLSSVDYKKWVLEIQKYKQNTSFLDAHKYWSGVLKEGGTIPTDYNPKARVTHREMKARESILLKGQEMMEKFSISIQERQLMPSNLLISVLFNVCKNYYDLEDLLINIMSQQRESFFKNIHIERTTGFFAGAYPARLSFDEKREDDLVQQINQTILDIPKNGLDYFILKHENNQFSLPERNADVLFHYLKTENIFPETPYYEQLDIPIGFTNSKDNESNYLLNITVMESYNQLKIRFYYSSQHFKENTIINLIDEYKKTMHRLLNWN